jgi:PAS domain S-box-containing protein
MQDFMRWLERLSRAAAAAVGLIGEDLVNDLNRRGLNPQATLTAIGLGYIGVVGVINLSAARGLQFDFFYLLGCAFVGWAAGGRSAAVCTLVSVVFLFLAESPGRSLLPDWVFLLNSLLRFLAFLAIGWLAAQVGRLTRDLERKIDQRTARLRDEVVEHKETAVRLSETLQLFNQLTDSITEVFWVTDPSRSRFQYVSPEFENVWGETRQSLYVSPGTWLERIHAEDRERVTQAMFAKQILGEYNEEYRVVRPDGSLRWVHDRAFPVKNKHGGVYRVVGIAEDITERKRTEQLLRAQRDVGIALSFTSDLRFALERMLEIAVQLEGIDCGGVYLLDPQTGELHLEAHRGLSSAFSRRVSHYRSDTTEARLVKSGEITYVPRDQIPRSLEVLWGSEGLRALAVVPVQHKGAVLGMLNLGSYRQDEILPKTRLGIEMIASQTAGGNARIRAEELLRRSEVNLRTIVHNAPIALFAGDRNGILVFQDGQALGAVGVEPGEQIGRPVAEVFGKFPLMAENVRRALAGEEFSSVLELGSTVLECHYTPTRDANSAITGFLGVATNVTERFRLQRQILEISDREQARIGQDIHDGLCQQLVSIAFDANSLEKILSSQQHPEAGIARRIASLLDEAITESRRVSRGLYPVRLETEGLVPALKDLAQTTSERFKVHCLCNAVAPGPACDDATAIHLYRIAQEAVNNALKHSGALHVSIQLTESNRQIELSVEDDGRGIRPAPERHAGMGLHTMDYRARSMGGNLRVFRRDRCGTVVSCQVPLKN